MWWEVVPGGGGWTLGARRFEEGGAGAGRHQTLDFMHPAAGSVYSRAGSRWYTLAPAPEGHRQLLAWWDLGGL